MTIRWLYSGKFCWRYHGQCYSHLGVWIWISLERFWHIKTGTKEPPFTVSIFKYLKRSVDWNFTTFCTLVTNWELVSMGAESGVVVNKGEAITWTNDVKVLWHDLSTMRYNCNISVMKLYYKELLKSYSPLLSGLRIKDHKSCWWMQVFT